MYKNYCVYQVHLFVNLSCCYVGIEHTANVPCFVYHMVSELCILTTSRPVILSLMHAITSLTTFFAYFSYISGVL